MIITFRSNRLTVTIGHLSAKEEDIAKAFATLQDNHDATLQCTPRQLWRYLQQHYVYVKAAGGIVYNEKGEMLIIRHYQQWDLPKGMVDKGETHLHAALREVNEETGVDSLCNAQLALKTYHIHNRYGDWQLKQTSWFVMHSTSTSPLTPQNNEDIDIAQWLPPTLWKEKLLTSYASMHIIANKITKE